MAHRRAHVIVGLGFGDEGKGSTVDYLTRTTSAELVVRYNGGAQAAHNVVTPDGVHHTFAQFGSGLLAKPNQQTILSRHMVMHPGGLLNEAKSLELKGIKDPLDRIIVDEGALVITPYHQAMNRIREAMRGDARHGSCGVGVGETVSDAREDYAIRARDLHNHDALIDKLGKIRDAKSVNFPQMRFPPEAMKAVALFRDHSFIYHTADYLRAFAKQIRIFPTNLICKAIRSVSDVIFEGAQGTLLDESWGFYPYTTWSNCTSHNALEMLREEILFDGIITTLGILRVYHTRHGAGPFPTESPDATVSIRDAGEHNSTHEWQGRFRVGWFDGVLARYAIRANNDTIDRLVLTNKDRLAALRRVRICTHYTRKGDKLLDIPRMYDGRTSTLKEMQTLSEELIKDIKPSYISLKPEEIVGAIEELTGLHAGIISSGPTWKDKKEPFGK